MLEVLCLVGYRQYKLTWARTLLPKPPPFVISKKRIRKKARGYDAKVGVVDSTRVGRAIFRFYFTELGL